MSAHTKKNHAEKVALKFFGPEANKQKAISALKALEFVSLEEAYYIPMAELFPDIADEKKAGMILAGARNLEGMTQKELAEKCGIPESHISEMEQGKRPIDDKTAKLLGEALNIGYKVFL